jgi:LacI family transcriptional regulator
VTKPFSIAEVAADAGVSPTTVSHALSGKRAVSKATRERIQASVERLNYRPNMVAKGLRSQRTNTIALLVADITNPYYPAVARSVHDVLTKDGYFAFIVNTDGDPTSERNALREMLARSVDGVIMQPMSTTVEEMRSIVGPAMPLVVIGDKKGAQDADQVLTDDAMGIHECMRYLAGKGNTEIAFISGPPGNGPGDTRLAAFRDALAAVKLPVREDWIDRTPYTRDGGAVAGMRMLARAERPRAIMCANDLIAIGVMDAARAANLRIPDDIAIVGFDNIETADLVSPRLTTVDNPAASVGEACATALLRRITDGRDAPHQVIALPTKLIARESA